jgi:hypothetical protein
MSGGAHHWYYKLDANKRPVPCSLEEQARGAHDWQLAETFTEHCRISTVFLGIDHGWRGPPILFETMVFEKAAHEHEWADGDKSEIHEDLEQHRYSSYDDAMTGHKAAVSRILRMEAAAAKAAKTKGRVS